MRRILAIDDHSIIRKGLKRFLEEIVDPKIKVTAVPGREALAQLKRERPDMVILEHHLQGTDGLGLLKELAEQRPPIPVLIFTDSPEEEMALSFFKLGADGYLTKDCPWEELVLGVTKILAGHKFITDSVAERLALNVRSGSRASIAEHLSKREREVASSIIAGKSLKDIASTLSLCQSTVSTYRCRVLDKLGFQNNAELIRFAAENPKLFTA